jgi:hypothetical protein
VYLSHRLLIMKVNLFSKKIYPFLSAYSCMSRSCVPSVIEIDKAITSIGKAEMRSMTSRDASRNCCHAEVEWLMYLVNTS